MLDANWMAAALGSDGAFTLPLSRLVKDRYEVFLFQCVWLLLGLVILKREAKPPWPLLPLLTHRRRAAA